MKMKNSKTLQWLPLLPVLASSSSFFFLFLVFFLLTSSAQALVVADTVDSVTDSIRIDSGAREDYIDPKTKIPYEADDDRFVEFGEAHNISSKNNNYNKEQIGNPLKTLRSFPEGKRNCYTLPTPNKNTIFYLVRTFFAYGNYDHKRTTPSFDLHIGVNHWATINEAEGDIVRFEVIHVSPTDDDDDDINVCLVNTGHGTPFISLLEVFPWQNSRYDQTASSLLILMSRSKLGMPEDDGTYIRYPDDIYGRSWFNRKMENTVRISASIDIDSKTSENTYKLPKEVLSSAVESVNVSSSLVINMDSYSDPRYDYYVYLHFYDFVNNKSSHKKNQQMRKMVITFSDGVDVSFTLEYLKPTTLVRNIKKDEGHISNISIRSASDSQLPAMLNAYEIFRVLPQPVNSTTDEADVRAIQEIKTKYGIKKISWQGDPCRPMNYTWEGLTCNNNGTPRITSINLSSSNLSGEISPFSNFTELKVLDLSNNNLTGKIPESLAVPEKLKHINLTRNKLKAPIPKSLVAKKNTGYLNLSTDISENSKQGLSKGEKIGIAAGATGGAAALSGATLAFTLKFRLGLNMFKNRNVANEKNKKNDKERRSGKKEESNDKTKETNVSVNPIIPREAIQEQIPGNQLTGSKTKKHVSPFIASIAAFIAVLAMAIVIYQMNNKRIKRKKQRGGFAEVYLCTLQDGREVVVKLLSQTSRQGYKEFHSEAYLLTVVHHKNLVSSVGYCEEGNVKALIYE